jgi:hypothetical protein
MLARIKTSRAHSLPRLPLYDFRAAFPSILRQFLILVLESAQIPASIMWSILQLYCESYHAISFRGRIFLGFRVESGIEQGCCPSGPLFAVVMDTFARTMCQFFPTNLSTRSFFDDASMVFFNAKQEASDALDVFKLFASSIRLELNATKSVVIPLWASARPNRNNLIGELLAISTDFILFHFSKHLGLLVGANARKQPWSLVLPGCQKAVRALQLATLRLPHFPRSRILQTRPARRPRLSYHSHRQFPRNQQLYPTLLRHRLPEASGPRLAPAGPVWIQQCHLSTAEGRAGLHETRGAMQTSLGDNAIYLQPGAGTEYCSLVWSHC